MSETPPENSGIALTKNKQEDSNKTNSIPKRETWSNKWDYILSVAGSFIGLGNIWRFPYLCFKHGGGAFLIPYGTFLFFAGIPIFYLEQTLGQLTSLGGIEAWRIVPSLKGIAQRFFFVKMP